MPSIRIFFHKGAEGFIRGLVIGTAIIDTGSKYASDVKRFNSSAKNPVAEFKSERYRGNIRTALIEPGHISKFYDFHEVLTIKNWQRRGEAAVVLAAESLKNERRGQQGVLVTPFRLKELEEQGRVPKTIKSGQKRIEVRGKDNIVSASFDGFARAGLNPERLIVVAPTSVEKLIDVATKKKQAAKFMQRHLSTRSELFREVHHELAGAKIGETAQIPRKVTFEGGSGWYSLGFQKVGQKKYVPISRRHRPR